MKSRELLRSFPDLEFGEDKPKLCLTDSKSSNVVLPVFK